VDLKTPIAALVLVTAVAVPVALFEPTDLDSLRIEAESGNCEALFQYGVCLIEGDGVDRDERQAIALWTEAGMRGHAPAAAALAGMYRARGEDPESIEEARYWALRAADLGHAGAMIMLSGDALERGDLVEAAVWTRLADLGGRRWGDRVATIESRLDGDARREVDRRCGDWMASHRAVTMVE
jgi:TPR repeat protein